MEKKLKVVLELQDKLTNEMKKVSSNIKEIETQINGLGKSEPFTPLKNSIFDFANSVEIQIAKKVLGVIKDVGLYALNASSDMEELRNITSQVFGNMQQDVEIFSESMSSVVGRSVYTIQKYTSDIGSIFKGLGIDEKVTKDMSEQLALLAIDIGSFKNISDDEAFNSLKEAIIGETEALKSLGIILNDTIMAEYTRNKGIKGNWQNLDQATKAELRYQAIMEKTAFMQGDAARTIGSYANQLKLSRANIDNLSVAIGDRLKPISTGVVSIFNSITESLTKMLTKKEVPEILGEAFGKKVKLDILIHDLKETNEKLKNLKKGTIEYTVESEKMKVIQEKLIEISPDFKDAFDGQKIKINELSSAYKSATKQIYKFVLASTEAIKARKTSEAIEKYDDKIREFVETKKQLYTEVSKKYGKNKADAVLNSIENGVPVDQALHKNGIPVRIEYSTDGISYSQSYGLILAQKYRYLVYKGQNAEKNLTSDLQEANNDEYVIQIKKTVAKMLNSSIEELEEPDEEITTETLGGSNGSNNSKEKPRTILDELKEYFDSIDTSKQNGIPKQSEAVLKQINDIEEKVENKINSLELKELDALQYKLDATNELISKTDKYSKASGNKELIKKVDSLKQKKEKLEKEINREKNNPIEKILSSLEEEVSLLEYSFGNDQLAKYLENRAKLNKSLLENIDKSKELGIFTNLEALENKKQILADEIKKMSEQSKYIKNDDDKNRTKSYIESLKNTLDEINKELDIENLIKKKEEVLKEFSEKLKNIFKDNKKDINSNKFDILFKDFFFDPIKQTKEELEKSRTKDEASKAVNNLKETILNIPEELAELININFDNLSESIENLRNQIDSGKLKEEEKQIIENILKLFSETKEKYKKFQEILEEERLEEQIKQNKEKQKKIVDEVKQYANEFLNSFVKFIKALPMVPEELHGVIDDLVKFFEQTMEFATNVAKAVISEGSDVESVVKAITSGIGLITTLASEMVEYFSDSKVIKKANEDYENKRKEIISNITALNNLTTTIKELNTNIIKQLSENTSEKNIKFQEKVLKSYIEVYSKNFNAKFIATGYKDRQLHESTKTKTALGFSFWSPISWGYGLYKLIYRKKENISAEKNLLDILGVSGTNSKELQEIYDKKIKNLKNEDLLSVFKEYDKTKTSEYYDKHDLDGQTLDFYITNSNLEELKKQFLERIEEVKKLEEKQKSLKRDSIFESFDGVSILNKEEQKKQIIENFKKLYADREDLPELIKEIEKKADELVENNARLVNVFDEVRNNIISNVSQGNNMIDSLANGLQSYFNKLKNNLSKVKYDGVFRDLEEEFENEFLKITEKLTDYRINGSSDIKKFAEDNIDFKTLFGKLKLVENINNDIKDVVYMLREQAKLQGLSEEYINMMFPLNDIKEKIFDVKTALSNAMTAAINTNSFIQFSMSLGDSIYSSVKNALIQAFVESDTYKNLFDKYFNTEEYRQELNKAISFKESFDIIQNQLNKAEEMLKGNGLSFRETNATNGEYLNGLTTKSNIAPTNIYSGNQAPTTFEFNLYNNGVMDNDTTRQFAKEVIKLMRENEKLEVRLNDNF